jgi:O-acetyl-ADP-ribose deacetylase
MDRIELIKGDITRLEVDAIVNAANNSLLGGGGVDGAIHRVAGPELLDECRLLKGCATGDAKITKGYKLPAKYIIHTVGPVWNNGNNNEYHLLEACYLNSLKLALQYEIKSLAFPAISTGAYRFPKRNAASIAVDTVKLFLQKNSLPHRVVFCLFDDESFEIYKENLGR